MTIEFSQFVNGGTPEDGDIVVGLRSGVNTQFLFPSVTGTTWNLIDVNTVMEPFNGYVVNSMGTITLTVPSVIEFGEYFEVAMLGSGTFVVQCSAGQTIQMGVSITSSGGSLTSGSSGDVVRLLVGSSTQMIVLSGVTMDFAIS